MDCEHAINLISAELDGDIQPGDRTTLDAHLTGCESCRATAQSLRLQDADLRRAFSPRREAAIGVGDRVIAELHHSSAKDRRRFPWVPVMLAAAAGFILAALVFRPWLHSESLVAKGPAELLQEMAPAKLAGHNVEPTEKEQPVQQPKSPPIEYPPTKPMTQLVFAKGVIEMQPPGSDSWRPLATGGTLEPGTRVRTDSTGRCEFHTPDGSEVRLNGNTELVFHTTRRLELAKGQVWSNVAEDEDPYRIRVPQAEADVTALGTQFDLACSLFTTILTVAQGSTQVEGKAGREIVQFGEQAKIVGGAIAERHRIHDLVVATSWVHEILVLKGHDNEELAKRMDDMLAQIGNAKMSFMYEKEILQLGDHCVLPLTRFIQSVQSKDDKKKRANAARILAKIARPWSVEDLIKLLSDDDREVRFYAAKALERLTDGQTHGLSADQWRDATADARTVALKRWHAWWGDNKDQFPTPPFSIEPIAKDKPDKPALKRPTKS